MSFLPKTSPAEQFELSPIKAMELAASRVPDVISLAQGIPSFRTPRRVIRFAQEKIAAGLCDKYSLTIGSHRITGGDRPVTGGGRAVV